MKYQRSALLAVACSYTLGMAAVAVAQDTASAPRKDEPRTAGTTLEEVVITGSFIRGTPEDAAMPVEVVTFEEIQAMGRPSNMDLVKNMSESGGVAGEANRVNFYPIGAATINLRSLGTRFTTVVFNGRRFPEQYSVNTGRFNNIAWIPNAAIGSVETLKAGGGATYGADAVAGVVNYVTRRNFEGLELNADYRYIEDSDGDYNADVLWGKDLGSFGDLMVSASYQHRSKLREIDRDWTQYSYLENPASWQFGTFPTSNPGSLLFQAPNASGVQASFTPATTPTSNIQMGPTGVIRDLGCTELGGFAGWSPTGSPACYTNTAEMEELVSESNSYNVYLEHNINVGDSLKFHTEMLLYRQDIPEIALASTFTSNPASWPLLPSVNGAPRTLQNVATTSSYFVPGNNPAAGYLANHLLNSNGTTALTAAQIAQITGGGRVALQNATWKPFGNGGTPLSGDYDLQEGHLKMFRVTEAFGGNLPQFWGTSLEWEIGLTYSKINDLKTAQDILVDRFQAALNGLGGAGCTGTTPGANGCQYFNPFSSAISRNVFTGATNPGYVGAGTYAGYTPGQGLTNDRDLLDWMYEPISFERVYRNYVFDPIIRGDTGIDLPGGPVALAIGGQFRMQTEDVLMDALSNRNNNPCPTLGEKNCVATAQLGPFLYNRQGNIFGAAANQYRPERRRYPVAAAFFETKLPLLSTLDVNLAGRYEKFFSDVTDIDNDVFVPAAAIKWQPLDWLGVRTSWGKTFSQVNPPRDVDPLVAVSAASAKYSGLGGSPNTFNTNNYPNLDLKPEKGQYLDVGFIVELGNFRGNVDFYDISVNDYTRQMTVANVLDGLAVPGAVAGPAASTLMNCSSSVLTEPIKSMDGRTLVELPGGNASCVQGTTTLSALAGGTVNYFAGVGQTNSGELKTNGIDLSVSYRFDNVLGGTLIPSLDVSRVLKWELGDFVIGGVKLANGYDGLGFVNGSTGRVNNSVAKYRASLGISYRRAGHMINILSQYVPELINENAADFVANVGRNANIGDANAVVANGATCTATASTGTLTSNLGDVPAGAGTGQYGTGVVSAGGARGLCNGQNTTPLSGQRIEALFNVDLVYRVELPWDTAATLTVNNVFDKEPSFFRGIVPYNSAYGSPLGRTFKLGVTKSF